MVLIQLGMPLFLSYNVPQAYLCMYVHVSIHEGYYAKRNTEIIMLQYKNFVLTIHNFIVNLLCGRNYKRNYDYKT